MKSAKLEENTFSSVIDMKREEFDSALKCTQMTLGDLTGLSNLLTLQYEQLVLEIKELSELYNKKDTDEDTKKAITKTIQDIYLIMFSLEYKVGALKVKIKTMQEQH